MAKSKLGRIRRDTKKIRRMTRIESPSRGKNLMVKVNVDRSGFGYKAYACIGKTIRPTADYTYRSRLRRGAEYCGTQEHARTPQSAIAKSLASLARTTARRGRK